MPVNTENFKSLTAVLNDKAVLVAVSKTKPAEDIQALYDLGQRDFGENYVQELVDKAAALPEDIRWHFIGHLQSNKVKFVVPFVYLIHGVDSLGLLKEINKEAAKINKVVSCLLQVHIAKEETKFGLGADEVVTVINAAAAFKNVTITGLMGMASFSDDKQMVKAEFETLYQLYKGYPDFTILSMGMSGDYTIALEEGSTMVRIGSMLFGERNYPA